MTALKTPVELETLANLYKLTDVLGEGGAGRVYGGVDSDGAPIAVKVLTDQRREKRKRFVNESNFLRRNAHRNLVPVIDDGIARTATVNGPYYVMPRYTGSLRRAIGHLTPGEVMVIFSGILDGVEAAHLLKVIHRDLKPENVLLDQNGRPAIADFGIASFTDEHLHTLVETAPTTRLANFQYAAPEQRAAGRAIGATSDIYALGLMLNELFTGSVPHGTNYRTIASMSEAHGFLDPIVAKMIAQNPADRHSSLAAVKHDIQKYHAEAVALQKLSELDKVVVPEGEITDPLAHQPPQITGVTWENQVLTISLDRAVSPGWIKALLDMGNYTSVYGCGPEAFSFSGHTARLSVPENGAQDAINYFKQWLPRATMRFHQHLEAAFQYQKQQREEALRRERIAEETRLRVNRSLTF